MKKHCFLTLFGEHNAESSKNAVFRKREKTVFCHTFWETSRKKLKKRHFFAFFANFVQSVSKNVKKTLFPHTFWGTSRKKLKKRCFSAFFVNFVQSVSKNVKKHCFLTVFGERRAKSSKNAVFRIFCELCSKCLEKREKTLFSHNFC